MLDCCWGLQLCNHFHAIEIPQSDALAGSGDEEVLIDCHRQYPTGMGINLPDTLPTIHNLSLSLLLLRYLLQG